MKEMQNRNKANKGLWCVLLALFLYPLSISAQSSYPTPPYKYERIFYIQRSGNTNTIAYDANFSGVKIIKADNPINVYWIRYADNGETRPLNYIQRTFAYGVSVRPSSVKNEFDFNLVSYAKKKLKLALDSYGNPYALLDINNRKMKLQRVFVKIEKGSMFTLTPKVEYIEFFGKDPNSGVAVYEKIVP